MSGINTVKKRWPKAKLIRPGTFANAPGDENYYISTNHSPHGGRLIGRGTTAKAAWKDAQKNLEAGNS